jgi:hypothetical protein
MVRFVLRGGLAAALLLLVTSGCEPTQKTATLTGKVTLDGKPLAHGTVLFAASGGEKRNAAAGDIKSDGSYAVQIGQTEKLIVGEYVVVVVSREPSTPHPEGGPPTPGAFITPEKYGDAQTSGLRYNVRPGKNIIDIVLVSDAPVSDTPAPQAEEENAPPVEGAAPKNAADAAAPAAAEGQPVEPAVSAEQPAAEHETSP